MPGLSGSTKLKTNEASQTYEPLRMGQGWVVVGERAAAGRTRALSENIWGQETPLEKLLSPCWAVHSHLSHHVAGDVACAPPTLAPVETISVLVSKHLEARTGCLNTSSALSMHPSPDVW